MKVVAVALCTVVGLALWGCAPEAPEEDASAVIELDFEHYTMDNGLDVILRKDDRVPVAAVNIWYDVSSVDEPEGLAGLAHLFEHMMLQGSEHAPGDYFNRLQAVGATGVNGNTDFDRTAFVQNVPSNQLELVLWAESDRMGFLLEALDEATLDNQKAVVRNERREVIDDSPYGLAQEQVYHALFPREHPYHHNIFGSHEQIQAVDMEDVRQFYERHYGPNNASLSIVGNIDLERTKSLIDKYFGSLPAAPGVDEPSVAVPQHDEQVRIETTDDVELPRVYMAWVTPPAFQLGDAEATLAARMLGGGKASRLFKRLVYEEQIAQSVSAQQRSLRYGSVFQITATAKPGHSPQELEDAIREELDRVVTLGPGVEELEATQTATRAIALKSLEPFSGVADRLNAYNHFLNDPGYLNADLQRYATVTTADIERFVADELSANQGVVIQVQPGEKARAADPPVPPEPEPVAEEESGAAGSRLLREESPEHQVEEQTSTVQTPAEIHPSMRAEEPVVFEESEDSTEPEASPDQWRFDVPEPGPAPELELPVAQRLQLDNGLPVFLVESHDLPLVTVQLTARSGSAADPPGMQGVTSFASAMLNEGTPERSALQIANDLTALGSTLVTGSSKEGSWVILQALTSELERSMPIMADVSLRPTFPEEEVERVRNDRLVAHRQQADDPLTTAFKVMWREMYGPEHPYSHLILGSREVIERVNRSDLQEAYRRTFGPDNAALILTGDLTRAEATDLAARYFGSWENETQPPQVPGKGQPSADRLVMVDRPGAAQTTLVLAQHGLARSSADFEELQMVTRILGRLFSSRLNQNLRETQGFTYDITAELTQTRGTGTLDIFTSVDTGNTGAAVREILAEVDRMITSPVSQQELDEAKTSVIQALPGQFMTNGSTAATLAHLYVLGVPVNYYEDLADLLRGITLERVHEVARTYLRPQDMKVIAVGDRAAIEPQLADLRLGAVRQRTTEAEPVPELARSR